MEVFGETRAFDVVVPGKAAQGRSINFGAMTDAFLAQQSRVRRDVDGGNHPFVASTGESMKAGLGVASICPTEAVDVATNVDPATKAVVMVVKEDRPFKACTGGSVKAGLEVASLCQTEAVDVAVHEDPTANVVTMVGDEEPEQSLMRIEAAFSLDQAQWDYLAWHKNFGSFKDTVGDLARSQSPAFCEVEVPFNDEVVLYGSNGLEALCSPRGRRCYNGGYCRVGSCPTVHYKLVYSEIFYRMLASELESKQH